MSVTIMSAVWPMDLPTTDKMVLLALADAANDDGVTWIAVHSRKEGEKLDLRKKTGLSERALQGAIKRLCTAGHLERNEKPGKGVIYTVHPRSRCAPHDMRPAADAPTPAADAGKPSVTVNIPQKTSSSSVERAPKSAHGTRLPDDWRPQSALSPDLAQAVAAWPAGKLERELSKFRNYWAARPGAGGRKANWNATWCNWLWKADEDLNRDRPTSHPQIECRDPVLAEFARSGLAGMA